MAGAGGPHAGGGQRGGGDRGQVERETGRPLPASRRTFARNRRRPACVLGPKDLLANRVPADDAHDLWMAWFAEFSIFYLYQTFVPTILAGEGYAIVKSFGYSVVILGAAIPAFVLGGQIAEWIDRKYAVLVSFARRRCSARCSASRPSRGRSWCSAGSHRLRSRRINRGLHVYPGVVSDRGAGHRHGDRVGVGAGGRDHGAARRSGFCSRHRGSR